MSVIRHYSYKILSVEASYIYNCANNEYENSFPKGIPFNETDEEYRRFHGQLDVSLETMYMEKKKILRTQNTGRNPGNCKTIDGVHYTTAIINVSFRSNYNVFNKMPMGNGTAYVRAGYMITGNSAQYRILEKDHVIFSDDGKTIIAIELPHRSKKKVHAGEDFGYVSVSPEIIDKFIKAVETDAIASKYFGINKLSGKSRLRYFTLKPAKFEKMKNKDDLRTSLYAEGFYFNGKHYVRYKRSAGSGREGRCLFIDASLLPKMAEWGECNIKKNNIYRINDPTSWEAYVSLTLSSLLTEPADGEEHPKTINLKPKEILVIPDGVSLFTNENEKSLFINKSKDKNHVLEVVTEERDNKGKLPSTNDIWDGQSLLDKSVFADAGLESKGMMLLRNRFFKSCAFNTNLRLWFEDNGISRITQLPSCACYHKDAKLKDIKLIVTPSSIKYLKFCGKTDSDKSLKSAVNEWFGIVAQSPEFGIVKTDKPTGHFGGEMVSTNYQLLNTLKLNEESAQELLRDSLSYLHQIQDNPLVLMNYLSISEKTADGDDNNDYEDENAGEEDEAADSEETSDDASETDADNGDVSGEAVNYKANTALKMLKANINFSQTGICRSWLSDYLSKGFRNKLKKGRILVNGTYATLFGNRAEMLNALIGTKNAKDPESFNPKKHCCYIDKNYKLFFPSPIEMDGNNIRTTRFPVGTELSCERSPHITMGNLLKAKNVEGKYDKYFNLTDEIVCVNAVNNNIQHRLNGCDYDSDTMLITDNGIILDANMADSFAVPVNAAEYRKGDINIVATVDKNISDNRIGEIVNLSQLLNTIYWTMVNTDTDLGISKTPEQVYNDICILAVLSGMEIDKAKRNYGVDTKKVLASIVSEIKKPYLDKYAEPAFFTNLKNKKTDAKGKKDISASPMTFIQNTVNKDIDKRHEHGSLCELIGVPPTAITPELKGRLEKIRRNCEKANDDLKRIGTRLRMLSRGASDSDDYAQMMTEKEEIIGKLFLELDDVEKNDKLFNCVLNLIETKESSLCSYRWLILAALTQKEKSRLLSLLSSARGGEERFELRRVKNVSEADKAGAVKIYDMYFKAVPV